MRHWINLSALALATGIATSALFTTPPARADDAAPSTQPTRETRRPGKLVKPWSTIEDSLTPEQKTAIIAVHQKANDEINAIHKKEEADIMALLKPEQVEELKATAEKAKAEEKTKMAE